MAAAPSPFRQVQFDTAPTTTLRLVVPITPSQGQLSRTLITVNATSGEPMATHCSNPYISRLLCMVYTRLKQHDGLITVDENGVPLTAYRIFHPVVEQMTNQQRMVVCSAQLIRIVPGADSNDRNKDIYVYIMLIHNQKPAVAFLAQHPSPHNDGREDGTFMTLHGTQTFLGLWQDALRVYKQSRSMAFVREILLLAEKHSGDEELFSPIGYDIEKTLTPTPLSAEDRVLM